MRNGATNRLGFVSAVDRLSSLARIGASGSQRSSTMGGFYPLASGLPRRTVVRCGISSRRMPWRAHVMAILAVPCSRASSCVEFRADRPESACTRGLQGCGL